MVGEDLGVILGLLYRHAGMTPQNLGQGARPVRGQMRVRDMEVGRRRKWLKIVEPSERRRTLGTSPASNGGGTT